jgi:hypothetical protein
MSRDLLAVSKHHRRSIHRELKTKKPASASVGMAPFGETIDSWFARSCVLAWSL